MKPHWQTLSAESDILIPFHDVDMANMVWHGNYAKYLEIARCALLDKIDYNYTQMGESGYYWPVVDMRLKYVKPCLFGQSVCVHAQFEEWEHRLKIRYLISDKTSGEKLTKAHTTQVAVDRSNGEMQLMSPRVLAEKLGVEAAS